AGPDDARDVNVNVTLEDARGGSPDTAAEVEEGRETRKTREDASAPESEGTADRRTCNQCGDEVDAGHVYCPNCGEKATHRVFCDCGDELRSDWAFCPGCGRRTPAADVLDNP
ncbi:zinc ribbon domain-containing protein, partial [Halobium palmae]